MHLLNRGVSHLRRNTVAYLGRALSGRPTSGTASCDCVTSAC
jgi:hypothetical protein